MWINFDLQKENCHGILTLEWISLWWSNHPSCLKMGQKSLFNSLAKTSDTFSLMSELINEFEGTSQVKDEITIWFILTCISTNCFQNIYEAVKYLFAETFEECIEHRAWLAQGGEIVLVRKFHRRNKYHFKVLPRLSFC